MSGRRELVFIDKYYLGKKKMQLDHTGTFSLQAISVNQCRRMQGATVAIATKDSIDRNEKESLAMMDGRLKMSARSVSVKTCEVGWRKEAIARFCYTRQTSKRLVFAPPVRRRGAGVGDAVRADTDPMRSLRAM